MAFALRRILELARDRRGTIMPAVTISAIVFVAMGGLVVDGGRLFWNKRSLQGAADAAALGGAFELKRGNRNLSSQIRPAAVNDASLNGANESNSTIIVNNPPLQGRHAGDTDFVEVIIQKNVETTLAKIFHPGDTTVVARSVAGLDRELYDACILALNETERAALKFNGDPTINGNCGIMTNSRDSSALELEGGVSIDVPWVAAVGGYTVNGGSGTIQAKLLEDATKENDPLDWLAPPDYTGWPAGSYDRKTDTISCPGGQCVFKNNLHISNAKGPIEFPPGTYILEDGMNITTDVTTAVYGYGVTFYNAGRKGIRISGRSVEFHAPTAAANPGSLYQGILMFADTPGVANNLGRGGASFRMEGSLHFKNQHLDFAGVPWSDFKSYLADVHEFSDTHPLGEGRGNAWAIIVADTLNISGSAQMFFNRPDASSAPPVTKVMLME